MTVDAVQPYQIIVISAFLLLLLVALFVVRRFRGGLSKQIHRAKRIRLVEDLALSPQQRLHLVEVDGQTVMIHTGKGHQATMLPINTADAAQAPLTLSEIQQPVKTPVAEKRPAPAKPVARPTTNESKPSARSDTARIDDIASAIAEARRRNPSLGLGK